MNVVISQSMYFPWVGMLEQVRLADVFVHYDDVQFSKGSFTNRVQVKRSDGTVQWMTVPLRNLHLGRSIREVQIEDRSEWVSQHMTMLQQSFDGAPYASQALELARAVFDREQHISSTGQSQPDGLVRILRADAGTPIRGYRGARYPGASSERVLATVQAVGGTRYITGRRLCATWTTICSIPTASRSPTCNTRCAPTRSGMAPSRPTSPASIWWPMSGHRASDYIQSQAIYWKEFQHGRA